MGEVFRFMVALEDAGECYKCGVICVLPGNMLRALRESKGEFYCPNGHPQCFTESATTRLQRELDAEKVKRARAEDALAANRKRAEDAELTARLTRGKLNALHARVKNGVCPCCKRSFVQLARHMATKHPGYADEKT